MRKLKLVGLSADGQQVVFVDEASNEYTAAVDDRLRAALRGDRARLGQLEIDMESMLRPRDIQARIRAGNSPEAVAAQAQVPVERVMPYCIPVLAERAHVTQLARRAHVRRKAGDSGSRTLADVVAERLRGRGIEPGAAEWDAWRREDGKWTVQATYLSGERQRSATFVFDLVGRYSLADDDEAKWLTGEPQASSKGPQPREAGRGAERRLVSVPDTSDVLDVTAAEDAADDDLTAVARAVHEHRDGVAEQAPDAATSPPFAGPDDDEPTVHVPVGGTTPADPAPEESPVRDEVEPDSALVPGRRRRSRRASVPSWDEIMFGKDDGSSGGAQ